MQYNQLRLISVRLIISPSNTVYLYLVTHTIGAVKRDTECPFVL